MITVYFIALTIIILISIIYYSCRRVTSVRAFDGNKYRVVASYEDREEAADLIASTNAQVMEFLRYLKSKYNIDHDDDNEAAHAGTSELHNIICNILHRYNPDSIIENDPRFTTDTSYTIDKGRKMVFCLRDKAPPHKLVDPNTLMFVVLHEISHIGNYKSWQHGNSFWTIFKFILHDATEFGIYKPVRYDKYPINYCGLNINYQPLNDMSLPNLWL